MIHQNHPPGSKETAFHISYGPDIVRGTVIHGGYRTGYGGVPPEVIFDKIIIEDPAGSEREVDFDTWLSAHPKTGRERVRMVEEMEWEAIAKVVKPRDIEDELACRGDHELDQQKDQLITEGR